MKISHDIDCRTNDAPISWSLFCSFIVIAAVVDANHRSLFSSIKETPFPRIQRSRRTNFSLFTESSCPIELHARAN